MKHPLYVVEHKFGTLIEKIVEWEDITNREEGRFLVMEVLDIKDKCKWTEQESDKVLLFTDNPNAYALWKAMKIRKGLANHPENKRIHIKRRK